MENKNKKRLKKIKTKMYHELKKTNTKLEIETKNPVIQLYCTKKDGLHHISGKSILVLFQNWHSNIKA